MERRSFLKSIIPATLGALSETAWASVSTPRVGGRTQPLMFGGARIDITPAGPVCLEGYLDPATRVATGVHDRLYARAFVFSQGPRRLVLVSCDIASMAFGDYLRRPLADTLGLGADEVLLCAIHTHSGPLLTLHPSYPRNVAYTERLPRLLRRVVSQAWNARTPARLAFGSARSAVGMSRRLIMPDGRVEMQSNPNGIADPDVGTVRVSTSDGTPRAVLFSYACHSRALRAPNRSVSGDVLGLAAQDVEQAQPGLLAAAFAGASGDIDPAQVVDGFDEDGGGPPVRFGRDLGVSVREALARATPLRVDRLRSRASRIALPPKHAGAEKAVHVIVAGIGELVLVGLDCEASTEIGLAIKAASPFAATLVVTNCNGWSGYLPVSHQYAEGGYEVEHSGFGPGAANLLVARVAEMLQTL